MNNPEIGHWINAGGINTNYHDIGAGYPTVLIHGSGPGVSAFSNWRLAFPVLSQQVRVLAPDMLGFGYTERPAHAKYTLDIWVKHLIDFLDALGLDQVNLIGNSFGGALTLATAVRHARRVNRIVLMGAAGVKFPLTDGLDYAWGYTPSFENMRKMLNLFAYDRNLVNDDLARLRYEASLREGVQESYASMFPAPRQQWIDALSSREEDIANIQSPALIIHGREDRILPFSNSLRLFELLPNSQLHLFGKCGHWTQIEHSGRFNRLVLDFLGEN